VTVHKGRHYCNEHSPEFLQGEISRLNGLLMEERGVAKLNEEQHQETITELRADKKILRSALVQLKGMVDGSRDSAVNPDAKAILLDAINSTLSKVQR
jgi:hypothetical protein